MKDQTALPRAAAASRLLAGWIARHARALALAAITVGAFGLLALLAYQLALARVPQHRAALERFVQAQTGFEVRFATLEVGLGWHGPEALFRHIELREPGQRAAVVRAPRLTVAFDTWRILRNGQVQAARITLEDPEIDLAPLLATAPRRTAAGDPLSARLRLLERLPLLRIDVEGGTLRVPPEAAEGLPHALRISRASLRRGADATSASALILLPSHLGRSLFLALRIEGPLETLARTSGTLRLSGRGLGFSSWREILPLRWAPAAGSGDVTGNLEWRDGELEQLEGEIEARGLAWQAREPQGLHRLPRLQAQVTARRRGETVRWQLTELELDDSRGASPAARLDLEVRGDGRISGESPSLPLGALLELARAAGLAAAPELRALRAAGELADLRFAWNGAAAPGERLHAEAQLHDLELAAAAQPAALAGLEAKVIASDERVELQATAAEARLQLPALFARLPESLALEAALVWSREGEGWKLASESVRLTHPAMAVLLRGELVDGGEGGALVLALRATLERLDLAAWQESFAIDPRWPTPAAVAAALGAGELAAGELVLLGSLEPDSLAPAIADFAGRVAARQVSIAAGEHWPEGEALAGELVWGGGQALLELEQGRAAGLELVRAEGEWLTGSARPVQLELELHGPVEQARAWLHTQPALRAELAGFAGLDLRGQARFALEVGAPRRGRDAEARWTLTTTLEEGQLSLGPTLPPLERLNGSLRLATAGLQSARLTGTWLGGPVTLRHLPRRARAQPVLAAEGQAEAAALLEVLGLSLPEPASASLSAAGWMAELRHDAGSEGKPAMWRAAFQAVLDEQAEGEMPAALAWVRDRRLPVAAQLELPEQGTGTLRLEAFGAARLLAALARREGHWAIDRAALRFGAGTPVLPGESRIAISGEVERLDVWAMLVAARLLEADSHPLPGSVDLGVRTLLLGSGELSSARLSGGFDERMLRLVLAGGDVAGSIEWPRPGDAARPVGLRFARLALPPERGATGAALAMLAAAPAAEVSIDDFQWGERRLGQLRAQTQARADGVVELREIRLTQQILSGSGEGSCRPEPRRCEWALQLESPEVAAALRALGFAADLQAGRSEAALELVWAPAPDRSGWAALSGRIEARLENGTVLPPEPVPAGAVLPPFAAPAAILRASALGPGFDSLAGTFELGGGELRTSDLQLVMPTGELEVSGRVDLVARQYDLEAVLTAGAGSMSAALRRMREERSLSAAIAAMRDLVGSGETQRQAFTLQGSWDAPMVSPVGEVRQ